MTADTICVATTVSGRPCRAHAMRGSTLCARHVNPAGNRTKLTPEVVEAVVLSLRTGGYVTVACRAAGISTTTYGDWMQRGKAESSGPHHDFRERVERAKAEGEVRNVAVISRAAGESWQAAAWLLERMYPERWGKVSVRLREESEPEPVVRTEHDPFGEVDELAERRRRPAS
jgi:hypothetical protein